MQNNQQTASDFIFGFIKSIAVDPYVKMFECSRISFAGVILEPGQQVIIEHGELVNRKNDIPTHEIIKLEGTLYDTAHQITVRNLSTNKTTIVKL